MNFCNICSEKYYPRKDKTLISKTCSKKCKMIYIGRRSAQKKKQDWEKKSEEQKRNLLLQSFEKFVIRENGCWKWLGTKKTKLPYGCITFRGKQLMAHRVSYQLFKEPIHSGLLVLHSCDNPECTNPDHLFLGTYLDNKRDQIKKGRSSVEKLNPEKVLDIKKKLKDGMLHKDISKLYEISRSTIWKIQTNKLWKDIVTVA